MSGQTVVYAGFTAPKSIREASARARQCGASYRAATIAGDTVTRKAMARERLRLMSYARTGHYPKPKAPKA